MGTFYTVVGSLVFERDGYEKWKKTAVMPVFPWTEKETTVADLLTALVEGDVFTNGEEIPSLPVSVVEGRVDWCWVRIASEIGPEVRAVSAVLWDSAQLIASSGAYGYRDALGPSWLWDKAVILIEGKAISVVDALGVFVSALGAEIPVPQDAEDIPF